MLQMVEKEEMLPHFSGQGTVKEKMVRCFWSYMTENAVEYWNNISSIQDICCEEAIVKCYPGGNFDF